MNNTFGTITSGATTSSTPIREYDWDFIAPFDPYGDDVNCPSVFPPYRDREIEEIEYYKNGNVKRVKYRYLRYSVPVITWSSSSNGE